MTSATIERPSLETIREAHRRIRPYIHRTPILTCSAFNERCGASVFFKCDSFQKSGSFKIRGATNAVFQIPDEDAPRGVATHSSGNHAGALSLAASWRGIPAYVVMPSDAPDVKKAAVRTYGGEITFCEPTLEARESTLAEVISRTGAVEIHPYDHPHVIAGQGTAALEILDELPHLDVLLTPVGGGGLLSGTLIAAKSLKPEIRVIAIEPAAVDDAYRSWRAGSQQFNPSSTQTQTLADGLKTNLGHLTYPIIRELVDAIVLVEEEEIVETMRFIWERMKIVIEPSSAVTAAPLFTGKLRLDGQKVGVHLCGGNVDLTRLPF